MKKLFFIILFVSLGVILMACNDDQTNNNQGETKQIEFVNETDLTVSTGVDADLTEGVVAKYEDFKLKVKVVDDGGYSLGKLGKINVTYEASYGQIKETFSREVTVNYYGLSFETLGAKALSGSLAWTFRNTVPIQTGNEWSRYVVEGHNPTWNRFEDSTGLVMLGSDTEGRTSSTEIEDNDPNTIIYNRFTFDNAVEMMRIYLSPNPYPDYNNLRSKFRISVIDILDSSSHVLVDWTEIDAPVPSSGAIDTTWYIKLQQETFIDVNVSEFAGRDVVFLIEQDSSDEVYQKEFYKSLGFSNKDANNFIKETRDSVVIYDIEIFDESEILPGLKTTKWSSLEIDDSTKWNFKSNVSSSSAHSKWEYLSYNNENVVENSNNGVKISSVNSSDVSLTYYNKFYMMGDKINLSVDGCEYRVRVILPNREILTLEDWTSEKEITLDLSNYVSQVITLCIDVRGGDLVLNNINIVNEAAEIMWTIGDSVFHIAYEMVAEIASGMNSALVTTNLSGTTISPCRMYENSMVRLIQSGAFDRLFDNGLEPTVILIQRGINDLYEYGVNHSIAMGDIYSTDYENTILGAVNFVIDYLQEKYPNARIVWASPYYSAASPQAAIEEYVPLLEQICEIKGIEFLDIYNTIGINKNNYNMYLYDGTHANAEGNKLIVKCWLNHLLGKE